MDATTGQPLDGQANLVQSITDLLSTPRGSRVMRRNYGSDLFQLIDQPLTPRLIAQIQSAVAIVLSAQEPRIRLTRVAVVPASEGDPTGHADGRVTLRIEGYSIPEGRRMNVQAITISR